ncbi:MAG: Verru_Chthon cassette protein A [Verrucomicrobiota bacterium]
MKPTLIQRLKARLLVSGHKKQQGVAILTVLAIITLMTVLVISFFNMAQTAQSTAKGSVEIQRVTTLKDTIINLVIAQFREASRLTPASGSDPRNIITWTSQPGAIRTYSGREQAKNRVYKLYSSKVPQLGDLKPGETSRLLESINDDIVPDWAERPDEFTDLNRPVYTAATGDRAKATGATDREGFSYPIVDPRAYNGTADREVNVEGFEFSQTSLTKRIRGVDARDGQLAMPVRWIYQLQDGTLGYLNDTKEFTSLNGKDGGEVSRLNPIVGRMAWWADDESCKVNVNTASVPAIWDTPRTTSLEDIWLAKTQPLAGEYQRYPGHPATVDLCAVLFPGRRYASTDGSFEMPLGHSMAARLKEEEANLIWDLAPFIVGNTSKGEVGTLGGTITTPKAGTTVNFEGDDHLFTSLDEVYFKASGATNKSLNSPRENLESQGKDARGEFLQRLERAQFFLTHKSHSPELTNQGFPRVSMFPMDTRAAQYVKTVLASTAVTVAAPPTGVSPYDVTMAINSTIGNRPYYFQRYNPTSRHLEYYATELALDPQRDINLMRYLKELSRLPIPGYPSGYPGAQPFQLAGFPEDAAGLSLASKYPSGYNPATRNRFADNNYNKQNGYTLQDASDRTQILLNMLDYTRSINMQPAFLQVADRYDDGNGQSTGLCGCGDAGQHANNLTYNGFIHRCPKGAGKLLAPAEIAMVVNVAAKKKGSDGGSAEWNALKNFIPAGSPSRQLADDDNVSGTRYLVEVGFVMSGFNPKLGWAPVMPGSGIMISTPTAGDPGSAGGNFANKTDVLPLYHMVGGNKGPESLRLCVDRNNSYGGSSKAISAGARPNAVGLIPYGGMQGPRAVMGMGTAGEDGGNNFAICAPICILQTADNDNAVTIPLQADPLSAVRIMILDGGASSSNVTSAVDLRLPTDFTSNLILPFTGTSLRKQALKYTMAPNANQFPDPGTVVRSFVIPHGDYRLATTLRMDNDLYVANLNYKSKMGYSFYESNEIPGSRQITNAKYNPQTIINRSDVPQYIAPGSGNPMSSLPLPAVDQKDMNFKAGTVAIGTLTKPQDAKEVPPQKLQEAASRDSSRRSIFAFGRRDGHEVLANRGSSDPDETGDFDTGIGAAEDGPYMNYPDEGDRRNNGGIPYFTKLTMPLKTSDGKPAQNISPNLLIRSPVDFGSIPSGLQARVPWQTLRFRPDPGMNDIQKTMTSVQDSEPPKGLPFANFCGPRDHFFLDMFWMPVVEPYSISEPFSTKGTINLNQQIFPFLYINRTTALHALLRGERMLAIPKEAAAKYKKVSTDGSPNNDDPTYRYWLNVDETVKQFTQRYMTGTDPEGFPLAFNSFRSASEICEIWLVPDKNDDKYDGTETWDLAWTIGQTDQFNRKGFWENHRITGDNARERPYANLYPRVTVRSNVFKLHMVAQTLQKARSTDPKNFDSVVDAVTAEWRGSCLIERSADARDTKLNSIDYTLLNAQTIDPVKVPRIDKFYTYRVTEVKQLTQ